MASSIQLICTPIGNLGDISFRAVQSLKSADLIACEDTRHSSRLLKHLEIERKELIALHDHNEGARAGSLVERALSGERIVFLSDAGTPTISDPGYRLVNACIDAGVTVEVIPGPSAVITALAGSGLPTDAFYFGGFLPVKSGKRSRILEEALARAETSIFFESPYRLLKTLNALRDLDEERSICVARELTKKFETYHRGTAPQILEEFEEKTVKGEITLLIQGAGREKRKARNEGGEARQDSASISSL
ncbi:MAG: 16S rRNA (cytidine(1402)-2'-O)-methyltransferase [Verrucomicrobiales bacterium]|nr:16S rRNA (cytidine(1402)-2'-O)-methyltransferase [Verrucomicrobiales bacterium]